MLTCALSAQDGAGARQWGGAHRCSSVSDLQAGQVRVQRLPPERAPETSEQRPAQRPDCTGPLEWGSLCGGTGLGECEGGGATKDRR